MNTQIYEEASNWFVELRMGDADGSGRKRFDAWVRRSPDHLRAYLEIAEIWQDAALVDAGRKASAESLIGAAQADVNVIALQGMPEKAAAHVSTPAFAHKRYAIAASFVLLLAAAIAFFAFVPDRVSAYSTGTGEQRILTLPDGSIAQINARSRMTLRFTADARDIELPQGQVLFRVAKDQTRPFIVHSGATQVRAVGTEFDVYKKENATLTVTVVEGRVAVADGAPSSGQKSRQPIMLSAGEQITLGPKIAPRPQPADVASATAWTQRRLVFRSSSLPEVAEEFNRYNSRPLIVADPRLASFNISGVYSSTDPGLLLRFLREQPRIDVHETDKAIVISSRE